MTGGVLAFADHSDGAKRERLIGALVKLLLEAPGYDRQPLGPGQTAVTTNRGQRFVVVESETPHGEPGIALVTGWERILANGDLELEVREKIERRELLQ